MALVCGTRHALFLEPSKQQISLIPQEVDVSLTGAETGTERLRNLPEITALGGGVPLW